jgi:hypothetical protein
MFAVVFCVSNLTGSLIDKQQTQKTTASGNIKHGDVTLEGSKYEP